MLSKYLGIGILFIVLSIRLSGQQMKNLEISNLPYYSFGKGLGITSPDSLFQLRIRFRMQNRFSYNYAKNDNSYFDGQIRRLRLRFDGYVGNPKWLYALQLSFAPGDTGEINDGDNLNIIRDAVVYYVPNKKWNIGFGQTKLPGNRQRVNSSGALQLTDRTINNARFNIDRDFGIFINYLNEKKDLFSYNIKTAISTGDGRNYTKSPDNGLAYTGKVEFLPLGAFTKDGVYFEGDLVREQTPKVMVSASYHYNNKAKRIAGVLGEDLLSRRNIQSVFIDGLFKYKGWSLAAAYMSRSSDNANVVTTNNESKLIYDGSGWDLIPSYHFANDWEIIGRISYTNARHSLSQQALSYRQFSFGLTKYIWQHSFKIQWETSIDRSINNLDNASLEAIYSRIQIELGI